jgi:hypothetical protein
MSIENYFSRNGCDSQSFYLQEPKFKWQILETPLNIKNQRLTLQENSFVF